jgi:hypothetical protein
VDLLTTLLVLALVVGLWVAAAIWGNDSRDGHDWTSDSN